MFSLPRFQHGASSLGAELVKEQFEGSRNAEDIERFKDIIFALTKLHHVEKFLFHPIEDLVPTRKSYKEDDPAEERQFVLVASEAEADAYPIEDDQQEPLVASQHFDLLELIEDEILLSLPLIPKHPESACEPHASSFGEAGVDADELEKPENPFNILKNMKKRS